MVRLNNASLLDFEEVFGVEHEINCSHRTKLEEPVEIVNIQSVAHGIPEENHSSENLFKNNGKTQNLSNERNLFW